MKKPFSINNNNVNYFSSYMHRRDFKLYVINNCLYNEKQERKNGAPFSLNYHLQNIKYFRLIGEKTILSNISGGGGTISGGGSSIGGAIVGDIVAGPTGAIIGSRKKINGTINEITTTHQTVDDRKTIIQTNVSDEPLELFGNKAFDTLMEIIPNKEYDYYISKLREKME